MTRRSAGQSINELLEKDEEGNFLLVDKLVAIANYYGFDGYFLNKEDYPNSMEDLHEFMRQMHEKGMYTQYYDGLPLHQKGQLDQERELQLHLL